MQLVTSPELQALVCKAGIPVELHCDRTSLLKPYDWLDLNVPVRHQL